MSSRRAALLRWHPDEECTEGKEVLATLVEFCPHDRVDRLLDFSRATSGLLSSSAGDGKQAIIASWAFERRSQRASSLLSRRRPFPCGFLSRCRMPSMLRLGLARLASNALSVILPKFSMTLPSAVSSGADDRKPGLGRPLFLARWPWQHDGNHALDVRPRARARGRPPPSLLICKDRLVAWAFL